MFTVAGYVARDPSRRECYCQFGRGWQSFIELCFYSHNDFIGVHVYRTNQGQILYLAHRIKFIVYYELEIDCRLSISMTCMLIYLGQIKGSILRIC